jgi:hypothetical protein
MTFTEAVAKHLGISYQEAENIDPADLTDEDLDIIDEWMLADECRQHGMAMVYDAGYDF